MERRKSLKGWIKESEPCALIDIVMFYIRSLYLWTESPTLVNLCFLVQECFIPLQTEKEDNMYNLILHD